MSPQSPGARRAAVAAVAGRATNSCRRARIEQMSPRLPGARRVAVAGRASSSCRRGPRLPGARRADVAGRASSTCLRGCRARVEQRPPRLPGRPGARRGAVAGRASSKCRRGRRARVEQRKSSTMPYQKKDPLNPARGNRGSVTEVLMQLPPRLTRRYLLGLEPCSALDGCRGGSVSFCCP